MVQWKPVRSISFDTSFLLKESRMIDSSIKLLEHDRVPCFVTSTVTSELEQLKIWGRITTSDYHDAMRRLKNSHSTIIDFKNRLVADAIGKSCVLSMEKHMGVKSSDIVNDCTILVSILKNGVDLFLSEDFHFTSEITKEVLSEVTNAACTEFHQMCDEHLFCIDSRTFMEAYQHGQIDLDVVQSRILPIRKSGKRLGE
jgi:hypothetical protein